MLSSVSLPGLSLSKDQETIFFRRSDHSAQKEAIWDENIHFPCAIMCLLVSLTKNKYKIRNPGHTHTLYIKEMP